MQNKQLITTALLVAAAIAIAVSEASAAHLEFRNSANGFKIVWNPLTFSTGGREFRCPVTLEGTFERTTIEKRAGTRFGVVTEAAAGTCTRNSMTVLRETLPWEITYQSFEGTLPNITSVKMNFLRMFFQINLEGIVCLARTSATQPFRGIASLTSGTVTGYRADETARIETSGGFFCGLEKASFSGPATSINNRAGTAAITIALI